MNEPDDRVAKRAPGRRDYPGEPIAGTGEEIFAIESVVAIYRENFEALQALAAARHEPEEP
jgi:hypothetical protein